MGMLNNTAYSSPDAPEARKHLELTMRDAHTNLEDFVTQFAYSPSAGGLEILSIDPPQPMAATAPSSAPSATRPVLRVIA